MILDVPDETARKLPEALKFAGLYLEGRYGRSLPADLVLLGDKVRHELERDRKAEIRSLSNERKRRQRRRNAGENVPFKKPGPAKGSRPRALSA